MGGNQAKILLRTIQVLATPGNEDHMTWSHSVTNSFQNSVAWMMNNGGEIRDIPEAKVVSLANMIAIVLLPFLLP